jgi:hypothetical protein
MTSAIIYMYMLPHASASREPTLILIFYLYLYFVGQKIYLIGVWFTKHPPFLLMAATPRGADFCPGLRDFCACRPQSLRQSLPASEFSRCFSWRRTRAHTRHEHNWRRTAPTPINESIQLCPKIEWKNLVNQTPPAPLFPRFRRHLSWLAMKCWLFTKHEWSITPPYIIIPRVASVAVERHRRREHHDMPFSEFEAAAWVYFIHTNETKCINISGNSVL